MNEYARAELLGNIDDCAKLLQATCIQRTGMNQVTSTLADVREWRAPSLKTNLKLGEHSLNDFPRILYTNVVDPAQIFDAWRAVVTDMSTRRTAVDISPFKVLFPDMPFSQKADRSTLLTQCLWAAWCSGGTLNVTKEDAYLKIGKTNIGFSRRTVTMDGAYRRFVSSPVHCPLDALNAPMGGPLRARKETNAVHRHLLLTLPDLAKEITYSFSTAVAAGDAFEVRLTSLFNIDYEAVGIMNIDNWSKARRIINTSSINPVSELYGVLRDDIGYPYFLRVFGNPHRPMTHRYTPEMRKRHTDAIDKLEGGQIELATVKHVGADRAEAANALLNFQRLMGG